MTAVAEYPRLRYGHWLLQWIERLPKFAATAAFLLICQFDVNSPSWAQDTSCTGPLSGTFRKIVVPFGASCTLSDATVAGDVQVGLNATLLVRSSTTIEGNVEAHQCRSLLLDGIVSVGGNVEIHQCVVKSGYTGPGIQIGGNFECHVNSAECVAQKGAIGGNVDVHNNASLVPPDISANAIGGDLKCQQNSPAPTHAVGPNVSSGKLDGQCTANLGFAVLAVPSGFKIDLPIFGLGGPISLDNFEGEYINGGIIPQGGVTISVTTVPQPTVPLTDFIADELRAATIISSTPIFISGVMGTAVFYTISYPPTPLIYKKIGAYLAYNRILYKLYLSYYPGDPQENQFIVAFEDVLNSLQFVP